MALSRNNDWKLAKVVEIRYADGHKKSEEVENQKEEEGAPKKTAKYDYYINYVGQERRNDRWVTEEQIRFN